MLLPLLVVVTGLAGMERLRSQTDARENRNAGKVINGKVVERGVVTAIERILDQNDPEVIILGNSLSNTDILPPLLAKRLGVKKSKVQRFSIPNSIGAHWYLILKNRVYANGHHPKLVIILSDMQSALATAPRTEASYLNLAVHMSDYEPVVDSKLGARNYALDRIRQNRGRFRGFALTDARNFMVDMLWYRTWNSGYDRKTEAALARVFDPAKVDMRLHNNVIPIFDEGKRSLQPFDPADLPRPEASFIGEITALVAENGGRVVFVRPPMSPLLAPALGDLVLPEVEPVATALVQSLGGTYLDTRAIPLEATHFHNVDHMNDEGAKAYTGALARVLRTLDGMESYNPRRGPDVDLLRFVDHIDGKVLPHEPQVVYRSAPPPIPRWAQPSGKCRTKMPTTGCFHVDALHFLSDMATAPLNPAYRRCSPVQVLEDGVPLPIGNVGCEEVRKHGRGRFCHTNSKITYTPNEPSVVAENGKTYTLALDPNRSCYGSQWLYPKDALRLDIPSEELAGFPRGANTLILSGVDLSRWGDDAEISWVRVRVRVGGGVRVDKVVSVNQLATDAGAHFAVSPPLRMGDRAQIEVTNDSNNFVLLTTARLSVERPADRR